MPALNFKKQFAADVELGVKRQTVRARRKDGRAHAKVGDTIKLYTGMRHESCRLLAEATVTRLSRVRIEETHIFLDGERLYASLASCTGRQTTDDFAQADGFNNFKEMADWFRATHGLPFEGTVIYWGQPHTDQVAL